MSGSNDSSDDARGPQQSAGAAQGYPSFTSAAPGLFPAYASTVKQAGPSWLTNSSFIAAPVNSKVVLEAAAEARRKQAAYAPVHRLSVL